MPECRKIVIVARGDTEEAMEQAIAEAYKRIRGGNLSGADKTDDGGFYFDVDTDVALENWPR